jgi:hypothetical protein
MSSVARGAMMTRPAYEKMTTTSTAPTNQPAPSPTAHRPSLTLRSTVHSMSYQYHNHTTPLLPMQHDPLSPPHRAQRVSSSPDRPSLRLSSGRLVPLPRSLTGSGLLCLLPLTRLLRRGGSVGRPSDRERCVFDVLKRSVGILRVPDEEPSEPTVSRRLGDLNHGL